MSVADTASDPRTSWIDAMAFGWKASERYLNGSENGVTRRRPYDSHSGEVRQPNANERAYPIAARVDVCVAFLQISVRDLAWA
jgi:hypothetical protein